VATPMCGYSDFGTLAEFAVSRFLVTTGFRRLQKSKIKASDSRSSFMAIYRNSCRTVLNLNRRQWPCESEAPEQRRCDDAYIYAIEQTAHPAIKSKNLPYQTALDVVVAIGGTFLETTNSKGRCPLGMFVSNLEL